MQIQKPEQSVLPFASGKHSPNNLDDSSTKRGLFSISSKRKNILLQFYIRSDKRALNKITLYEDKKILHLISLYIPEKRRAAQERHRK
jgi:hypothetical protein